VLVVVAAVLAAPSLAGGAAAADDCPTTPLRERLEAADAVFVGRLLSQRPAATGSQRSYRFAVDQPVKGPLGAEVEARAPALVDRAGVPLREDITVGVLLAAREGGYVTGSCSLVDPAAVLAVADEPRGEAVKIVIGLVILALVLAYSARRLRRRGQPPPVAADGGNGAR
jgi:hypothetical protein